MSRNVNPRPQFLDSAGDPLGLGKMYYFESDTDTPKVTYADVNQTIANTHPVLLTADGRLPNVFFSGSARQKLTDSDDVQLWDVDPVGADDIGANFDDWNPLIIYDANDIVQGSDNKFYISINAGNQNNDPTTTPSEWAEIEFINIWNVNVTYQIGNTVKGSDNLFYISLTASNLGNDPVGDVVNWGPPFVGVGSVVAGTGITVDATDPNNPIVAAINNGDVVGPVSSVDNEIALFDQATGKLLKAGPITGTASGNVPLVGTKSSTETLAGLVEKSSSAENVTGTDDTVWPTVAGAKEILDTFAMLISTYDPATIAEQLVGLTATQTLTGKTYDANGIGNVLSNIDIGNAIAASQAEAETGTDNTKLLTSLRVAQAIAAQASSKVVQVVSTQDGALATGTTIMPSDDSIPQNTEGDEYMTLAVTPTSATNILEIATTVNLSAGAGGVIGVALFQDTTAGAIAVAQTHQVNANNPRIVTFTHSMPAGTTSSTTFKIRIGSQNAGTTTFNGNTGARTFGGVLASSIRIKEYAA